VHEAESARVPVVRVEEHHEVFWVWRYGVERGWLCSNGNQLLHVDEHSDMSLPRFRRPLSSVANLADLLTFVYDELDIGNFIWPAIYQGLFSRVFWVRHAHTQELWKAMRICAKTDAQCEFVTGSRLSDTPYADARDMQSVQYSHASTRDTFPQHESWTLDIDFDYFCCNSFPDISGERIEITRQSFEHISRDRYHFLRIAPGSKVSFVQEQNRYYLEFNSFPEHTDPVFNSATIIPRLNELANWLQRSNWPPKLITICRSVRSGYTPRTEADFIDTSLRAALQKVYVTQDFLFQDLSVGVAPSTAGAIAVR
jgi:hypothetical protein